jgi:hypothetical protein
MTPTPIKSGARLAYQGGTFNEIHAALAKMQRERNEKILLTIKPKQNEPK